MSWVEACPFPLATSPVPIALNVSLSGRKASNAEHSVPGAHEQGSAVRHHQDRARYGQRETSGGPHFRHDLLWPVAGEAGPAARVAQGAIWYTLSMHSALRWWIDTTTIVHLSRDGSVYRSGVDISSTVATAVTRPQVKVRLLLRSGGGMLPQPR